MMVALILAALRPPVLDAPKTLRDLIIAFPFFAADVLAAYAVLVWFGPAESRA